MDTSLRVKPGHRIRRPRKGFVIRVAAAAAGCAASVVGCGGSVQDAKAAIRQAIADISRATRSHDDAALCRLTAPAPPNGQLTPAQRQLLQKPHALDSWQKECRSLLAVAQTGGGPTRFQTEHITVDGNTATARIMEGGGSGPKDVTLVNADGRWLMVYPLPALR